MGGLANGKNSGSLEDLPQPLHGLKAVMQGRNNVDGKGGPPGMSPHLAKVPAATPTAAIATPAENYAYHSQAAADKHAYPWTKLVVLGVMAGAYIGLGYSLCCLVGGQLSPEIRKTNPGYFNLIFGIYGFPMGLTLCVVAGADLYTSNCMYTAIAVAEGRYGVLGMLRCLVTSYLSNLVGALLLVGLMLGGGVFEGREAFVIELAHKKVSHSFGATFCKGILCNWLVCLAVWQGNMARDLPGKFVGIFLPNSAFVSMGFEHCIANMYLLPLSMALGSGISVGDFIVKNLIPSTLGNFVGGSLFVGTAYSCAFGTPAHWVSDLWEAALTHGGCLPAHQHPQHLSPTASALPVSANSRHHEAAQTEEHAHITSGHFARFATQ